MLGQTTEDRGLRELKFNPFSTLLSALGVLCGDLFNVIILCQGALSHWKDQCYQNVIFPLPILYMSALSLNHKDNDTRIIDVEKVNPETVNLDERRN